MGNAFPGPSIARSATGRPLAEGPPGPPGLQGLPGPKGDTGPAGTGGGWTQQSVSGAGSVNANAGAIVFADASSGTVTVHAPALAAAAEWGITDGHKGGSFNASQCCLVPNASGVIEDPGNPGNYTTNPIKLVQPNMTAIWMADPTSSFWKVIGG